MGEKPLFLLRVTNYQFTHINFNADFNVNLNKQHIMDNLQQQQMHAYNIANTNTSPAL